MNTLSVKTVHPYRTRSGPHKGWTWNWTWPHREKTTHIALVALDVEDRVVAVAIKERAGGPEDTAEVVNIRKLDGERGTTEEIIARKLREEGWKLLPTEEAKAVVEAWKASERSLALRNKLQEVAQG